MRRYSEAVKADVRRRMHPPHRQSVAQISKELGTVNSLFASTGGGLDQPASACRGHRSRYIGYGGLISGRGVIFPARGGGQVSEAGVGAASARGLGRLSGGLRVVLKGLWKIWEWLGLWLLGSGWGPRSQLEENAAMYRTLQQGGVGGTQNSCRSGNHSTSA